MTSAESRESPIEAELRRSWAASTFDAFRFPLYRVVWLGSFFAFMAFNMASTAQGVVAFDITGNNHAVGFVAFGQGLAMFFLNPFGGAIADRFSKRFLLLIAQAVIGAVMFATAVLLAFDAITIAYLALGSFIMGTMFSFLGPTRTALLAEYVEPERIGNAMALMQVGNNFARIGGPFLAGTLLAWSVIGATGVYALDASIFIFVLLTLSRLPESRKTHIDPNRRVLRDIRLGFRYITSRPRLLHTVLSFHVVMVLALSNYVLMPGLCKEVFDVGNAGVGILLGVSAAGGFVMSLVVASLADSKRAPLYIVVASMTAALGLIGMGAAPSFPLAVLGMVFVTGGTAAFQTLNNSFALHLTEGMFYGRVTSFIFMAWGVINLASLPVGYLADAFGEQAVLAGEGVALVGIVIVLWLWSRFLPVADLETL
jgi:predicted MFS family arabinose efflux permease